VLRRALPAPCPRPGCTAARRRRAGRRTRYQLVGEVLGRCACCAGLQQQDQASRCHVVGREIGQTPGRQRRLKTSQKGSNHARQNNRRGTAPKHRGGKHHTGGNSPQGNPTRQHDSTSRLCRASSTGIALSGRCPLGDNPPYEPSAQRIKRKINPRPSGRKEARAEPNIWDGDC